MKLKLVSALSKYSKIFISSEVPLPGPLEKYRINLDGEYMHSLLAFSSLVIGESSTMCAEASVLGTKSIYLDFMGRGYTDILEKKYSLLSNYINQWESDDWINEAISIVRSENSKQKNLANRSKLLSESVDVVEFMLNEVKDTLGVRT